MVCKTRVRLFYLPAICLTLTKYRCKKTDILLKLLTQKDTIIYQLVAAQCQDCLARSAYMLSPENCIHFYQHKSPSIVFCVTSTVALVSDNLVNHLILDLHHISEPMAEINGMYSTDKPISKLLTTDNAYITYQFAGY